MQRCSWCGNDPLYIDYHDSEWGRPQRDGLRLFEKLCLEGFQAGVSWILVLKKRENFRKAFSGFNPEIISQWGENEIECLMNDAGIIRNQAKIRAMLHNARVFLSCFGNASSFSEYVWSFTDGKTITNHFVSNDELPAFTEISTRMSKELKKLGFKYVGPTICYSFMQSMGLVNDHSSSCFVRDELGVLKD